jgi:hypothetical protein
MNLKAPLDDINAALKPVPLQEYEMIKTATAAGRDGPPVSGGSVRE